MDDLLKRKREKLSAGTMETKQGLVYTCPTCPNLIYKGQKYCDECGQLLLWEEV